MMKRVCFVFALLLVSAVLVSPVYAAGAEEAPDDPEDLTIGVVIPWEIGWYSAVYNGWTLMSEQEGFDTVFQHHEYDPARETDAVENLLAMGVDAINLTGATADSAQYSLQLANEAGIPVQITESAPADGPGESFAYIDFDWYELYQKLARELRAAEDGELNVMWIQGTLGSPPVQAGIRGFEDAIADMDDLNLATDIQGSQYDTESSLETTKAMVQAGVDFNVAMGSSQEITEGIIQGLREEGVDLDDVIVITINGGPTDVMNLEDGSIDYCMSISPGLHAMINAQNMVNYMTGVGPYQEVAYSPMVWCTQDNWEEKLIPWDIDEEWMPVVEDFVETGEYNPDLRP